MKNVRITDKEIYGRLIEIVTSANVTDKDILIDRLNHKIELIENKASKRSEKPTKTQTENMEYKDIILDILANSDKPMTIVDIKNANEKLIEFTPQKISALLQALGDNGTKQVIRTEQKRKAYFSIA